MNVIIDHKCDFDENYFRRVGHDIGKIFHDCVTRKDWLHLCQTLYRSQIFTEIYEILAMTNESDTLEGLISNKEILKRLVCMQRVLSPMYYALYEIAELMNQDLVLFFTNYVLEISKQGLTALMHELVLELQNTCFWVFMHGADGDVIRGGLNRQAQRMIEKAEKKYGRDVGLYFLYTGTITYKCLLEKCFMPELLKRRERYLKKQAEQRIREQTEKLYGQRFVESERVITNTAYCDGGFHVSILQK